MHAKVRSYPYNYLYQTMWLTSFGCGHAIALDFKLAKNPEAAKYAFTQAAHGQTKLSLYPLLNAHFRILMDWVGLWCYYVKPIEKQNFLIIDTSKCLHWMNKKHI